jgi:hypothetical protein
MTLEEQIQEENEWIAKKLFERGEKPSYSSGICELITAGYGELDQYGYWQHPLHVNQDTLEATPYE